MPYYLITLVIIFLLPLPAKNIVPKKKKSKKIVELIIIDNIHYRIPKFWKNKKIPFKLEAKLNELKALPQNFTYMNYNIYITQKVYKPLLKMLTTAEKNGVFLKIGSGFRSFEYQKKIIKKYLKKIPFKEIVKKIAPPGYSEHMLGSAVDFVPSNSSFKKTQEYDWLKKNAHLYGFQLTYTNTSLDEPWHWNYKKD